MRSLLFLLLLLSAPAFANDRSGSGGGIDHGGGGTFVTCGDRKLIFWDIFFTLDPPNEPAGDRIVLSAQGEADQGEWVRPQDLKKAFDFVHARVNRWRKAAPKLTAALDRTQRTLPIIATTLYVQDSRELSHYFHSWIPACDPIAVPGAFFDFRKGIAFVDLKVWNQVTLRNQAAMLLHERLRMLQLSYPELSNNEIQEIVKQVITDDHVHPDGIPDDRFDARFYRPVSTQQIAGTDAKKHIAYAIEKGILGPASGERSLRANGRRNGVHKLGGTVEIEPLTCERRVGELRASGDLEGALACGETAATGAARLWFHRPFEKELEMDLSVALPEDGAGFTAELLKPAKAAPGVKISFARVGGRLELRLGRAVKTIDVENLAGFHEYVLRANRDELALELTLDSRPSGGAGPVILRQKLPRGFARKGTQEHWALELGEKAQLGFIRVFHESGVGP